MGKKKGPQKGASKKHKQSGSQKSAPATKKASTSSETPAVDSGFTEVKRRKRLPRTCKKDERADAFASCGLQVRKINGDGNCLFRAFADQLDGSEKDHQSYRKRIVDHLVAHKDDFAGFHELEEEKSFDDRLKKLAKLGSYGGQECLVAFARIYGRVVYVHQPDEQLTYQLPPCQSTDLRKYKQVHIMYTGGNHYDSIRLLGDASSSPAALRFIVDENGRGSYDADTRPDVVINEPPPAVVFQENSEEIPNEPANETEEDGEKDSAIGSECSGSISSTTSGLSDGDAGEVVLLDGDDSAALAAAEPIPETLSPVPVVDIAQIDVLPINSSHTEVRPEENITPVPVDTLPEKIAEESSSPSKIKPLSKQQKRQQKKLMKSAAARPSPTPIPKPADSIAMVTRSMSQLQLTSPRVIAV